MEESRRLGDTTRMDVRGEPSHGFSGYVESLKDSETVRWMEKYCAIPLGLVGLVVTASAVAYYFYGR